MENYSEAAFNTPRADSENIIHIRGYVVHTWRCLLILIPEDHNVASERLKEAAHSQNWLVL